jgi:hypothetical protein
MGRSFSRICPPLVAGQCSLRDCGALPGKYASKAVKGRNIMKVEMNAHEKITGAPNRRKLSGRGPMAGAGAFLAAAFMVVALTAPALAAKKQLSDKAVAYLMNLTWAIMPDKVKTKDGKEEKIDKNNRQEAQIPTDDARRVIMVARRSAHAQICKLPKLQKANYRTMMHKELSGKKWSRKQIVYINQLHLFTVMFMTGNVTVAEDGAKNDKAKKPKELKCSDDMKQRVKAEIEAYVKANPLPQKTAEKVK